MNTYYDRDKDNEDMWGMTAFDVSVIIGHLTMRCTDSSREMVRLGFIIIDDRLRGKGYGREMFSMAVGYAFEFLRVRKVSLRIFENNEAAKNCCRACGSIQAETKNAEIYRCLGETWKCLEMELYNKYPPAGACSRDLSV